VRRKRAGKIIDYLGGQSKWKYCVFMLLMEIAITIPPKTKQLKYSEKKLKPF
jgi:hypothetical protein